MFYKMFTCTFDMKTRVGVDTFEIGGPGLSVAVQMPRVRQRVNPLVNVLRSMLTFRKDVKLIRPREDPELGRTLPRT